MLAVLGAALLAVLAVADQPAWGQAALAVSAGLVALAVNPMRQASEPRLAWLWTFTVLAVSLWGVAALVWAGYGLVGARPPLPALADPLYMAGHLVALAAALTLPVSVRGRLGRLRLLLDVALLSVVSGGLGWALLLAPVIGNLQLDAVELVWVIIYPALDVLLLGIVANAFLLLTPADLRGAPGMLALGLVTMALADLVYSFINLRGLIEGPTLGFNVGRLAAWSLLALATDPTFRARAAQPPGLAWRWLATAQNLLPLAATLALLAYVAANAQFTGAVEPLWLGLTALLALMLVARQGVAAGEAELSRYAQLVQAAADPAFVCTAAGRLTLGNPALYRALGYPDTARLHLHDLLDQPHLHATHGLNLAEWQARALRAGWEGEVRLRRANGTTFPARLAARPLASPDQPGLAGVAFDLTATYQQQAALRAALDEATAARQALQDLNAQLEARVAEKTRDLTAANAQLARQNTELHALDQLKSEFVSLVSHELRAPLTNLSAGLEVALLRPETPASTRHTLSVLKAETSRLTRFVETILDLSALEAGRLPLEPAPVFLPGLLATVQTQFAARPGGHRLSLTLPADLPAVLADERALTSVFFHLVDNAFKYAPAGPIEIGARLHQAQVCVWVADAGPGIPPDQRDKLFALFSRLHTRDDRAVYGHGLGLYMAQRLMHAQGGHITLAEAPLGARFEVYLPAVAGEM